MSSKRFETAYTLLKLAGFTQTSSSASEWVSIDKIADIRAHVISKKSELERNLPRAVLGDLSRLSNEDKYRRTLLSFIRRLAFYCHSAIIRKRIGQTKRNKKKHSVYGYKLVM
jgi:hypothetical protein